jgi:hypothetical protein
MSKTRGSHPEAYTGKADEAESFWSALDNYYWLNQDVYTDEGKKVSAALTHFSKSAPLQAIGPGNTKKQQWPESQSALDLGLPLKPLSTPTSSRPMYSTHMGNRPFNEWYQEWSVHAARAGVDEKTRMFAFQANLPEALHNKLLGLSPQPTTLAILVDKTRLFDNAYHAYRQNRNPRNDTHSKTARTITTEEQPSTSINYANLEAAEGNITPEEKQQCFKENLCLYCAKPNHHAKDC